MTRRRGDDVPTEPIPPATLAEVANEYRQDWTLQWSKGMTSTTYPWGRLAALEAGDRFDVVAVYDDGPRGAIKIRRYRTGHRSFAATFGTVEIGAVIELAVALERWGIRFARALEEAEAKLHLQLCAVCGARCYDKSLGIGPVRGRDGRCQRCAASLTGTRIGDREQT